MTIILTSLFELDRYCHLLRGNQEHFEGVDAVELVFCDQKTSDRTKLIASPDKDGWSANDLEFSCPTGICLSDELRIGIKLKSGTELNWSGPLSHVQDVTKPQIMVSRTTYMPLRGTLIIVGWVVGIEAGATMALFSGGKRLAATEIGNPRPDVQAAHSLIQCDCGYAMQVEIPFEADLLDTLELRVFDRDNRIIVLLPIPAPETLTSNCPRPLLPVLRTKAEALPRARLEWLIASEAFRRRWQRDEGDDTEEHPYQIAREVIAQALAKRLGPNEEIGVRLTDGDFVLCRPFDDGVLARRYLLDGHDELGFLRWLSAQVGPGSYAIDVGGGYGVMSRTMARRGASVVTVEADATAADRIRRAGLELGTGRIELVEAAIGARVGELVFAGMGNSLSGSGKVIASDDPEVVKAFLDEISQLGQVSLISGAKVVHGKRQFTTEDVTIRKIPAVTLDSLCTRFGLSDVAIVKIDVEGGELEALRGGTGLLDGVFGRPPIVAFEYSNLFPTRGGQREEILEMFFQRGWQLWKLADGKNKGGSLLEIKTVEAAPGHDNVIAIPPGRTPLCTSL